MNESTIYIFYLFYLQELYFVYMTHKENVLHCQEYCVLRSNTMAWTTVYNDQTKQSLADFNSFAFILHGSYLITVFCLLALIQHPENTVHFAQKIQIVSYNKSTTAA